MLSCYQHEHFLIGKLNQPLHFFLFVHMLYLKFFLEILALFFSHFSCSRKY